jgi:hypothetical protein
MELRVIPLRAVFAAAGSAVLYTFLGGAPEASDTRSKKLSICQLHIFYIIFYIFGVKDHTCICFKKFWMV